MADPIERSAAIDAVNEQIKYCDKALTSFDISLKDEYAVKVEKASLNALKETLEYLPSAQPVVRCGECKHMMPNGRCREFADESIRPSASDFCSAGERRDGKDEA